MNCFAYLTRFCPPYCFFQHLACFAAYPSLLFIPITFYSFSSTLSLPLPKPPPPPPSYFLPLPHSSHLLSFLLSSFLLPLSFFPSFFLPSPLPLSPLPVSSSSSPSSSSPRHPQSSSYGSTTQNNNLIVGGKLRYAIFADNLLRIFSIDGTLVSSHRASDQLKMSSNPPGFYLQDGTLCTGTSETDTQTWIAMIDRKSVV